MFKKSDKVNKILKTFQEVKSCPSSNSNQKRKSKKSKLFDDLYGEEMGVIELKMRDFKYNSKKGVLKCIHPLFKNVKRGIIIFYAPWCTHCNNIYDDIVELSLNYMYIFPIAVVNIEDLANQNDLLTNYAGVSRYPTMKIVKKNFELDNYNNEINKDNIIYFVNMNMV